jgi:hypothetical protein
MNEMNEMNEMEMIRNIRLIDEVNIFNKLIKKHQLLTFKYDILEKHFKFKDNSDLRLLFNMLNNYNITILFIDRDIDYIEKFIQKESDFYFVKSKTKWSIEMTDENKYKIIDDVMSNGTDKGFVFYFNQFENT